MARIPAFTMISARDWADCAGTVRNADLDAHPPDHVRQLAHMEYLGPVDFRAHLASLRIEGGDEVEAVVLEPLIAQEGGAEVADADEIAVGRVVPAEKVLYGRRSAQSTS